MTAGKQRFGHADKDAAMAQLLDAPGTCRVLVADDDRDAADSLVGILKLWGFTAHAVYDGARAVLADEALPPSLGLLDINMPRLDGFGAATVIRSWPGRAMRLVALTGRDSDSDRVLAASVGFDAHICKPIGRARLHLLALEAGPSRRQAAP